MEKSSETRKKNDGVIPCFNCGKNDYIARNCSAESNWSNNSTLRKRKAEKDQATFKSNQSL